MRIAIDARMYGSSGIGRYIRNLILNLKTLDRKNQYFILHLRDDFEKLTYSGNFQKVPADFGWYGTAEQIRLPGLLKSLKPDLVHFPHFNAPVFFGDRFLVTIHDLIHQHFSMQRATTRSPFIYKLKQLGYKKVFKHAIEKSCKILVPSYFVRRQLEKDWHVPSEKIVVTHEAPDDIFAEIKSNKKTDFPYIFYVGNAHPHKNIEGLIKAFKILKKTYPELKLVLAGNDHYFWQRIKKEFSDKSLPAGRQDIIFAGFISDEELVSYYKNARCFVMPSFEEGFGIPLLEAFACSCPVVSSDAGSLPEVGADAAIYFDPAKPEDMADKIEKVLESDKLRKELIEKGKKRVKDFSWKKLAEQTLEVYRQCA